MIIKRIYLILLLLGAWVGVSYTQAHIGRDILNGHKAVHLPFEYENGMILIKARFNNLFDLSFILDTGATNNIIFHKVYADISGLKYTDTINIMGADLLLTKKAFVSRDISLTFDEIPAIKRDFIFLESFENKLESSLGKNIHGILGGEFIKGLILKIDYANRKIILYDPNHYHPTTEAIPIRVINRKPYLQTKLALQDTIIETLLLVDSGSSAPMILRNQWLQEKLDADGVPITHLGLGLNGDLFGHISNVDSFTIGNKVYRNVTISSQVVQDTLIPPILRNSGLIGENFLNEYAVTIDYLRMKLYLDKRKKFPKKSYDKSGMIVHATGIGFNRYEIAHVIKDSPAEKAGLMKGDEIRRINIFPKSFLTLSSIRRKLRGREGKRIVVVVKRGDKRIKKKLTLKSYHKKRID